MQSRCADPLAKLLQHFEARDGRVDYHPVVRGLPKAALVLFPLLGLWTQQNHAVTARAGIGFASAVGELLNLRLFVINIRTWLSIPIREAFIVEQALRALAQA